MGPMSPYFASLMVNLLVSQDIENDSLYDLPDHELVVSGIGHMVGVCRSEEIIGHIGTEVAASVVPIGSSGQAADAVDNSLCRNADLNIGV